LARASKSVGGAKSIDLLAVEPGENHTAKLAKAIFRTAIDRGASDIHLHPFVGGGVIRFRIDGLLQRIGSFSAEQLETLSRYLRRRLIQRLLNPISLCRATGLESRYIDPGL
jgi:type II secretory ATPase GspE/PulE/Tfp pilus assembly ATPase PilB-like protein